MVLTGVNSVRILCGVWKTKEFVVKVFININFFKKFTSVFSQLCSFSQLTLVTFEWEVCYGVAIAVQLLKIISYRAKCWLSTIKILSYRYKVFISRK